MQNTPSQQLQVSPRPALLAVHAFTAFSQLLCAGGAAGAVAKTCVSPLERTRILRQTGQARSGVVSTVMQIVRNEGWAGLWRGNLINCYRAFPSRGLLFSCNDLYKTQLARVFYSRDSFVRGKKVFVVDSLGEATARPLPSWMSFAAGSLAGMTASTATYPLDVARTRIAGRFVHGSSQLRDKSGFVMLLHMARKEGVLSWYRGIGPTLLGAVPYEGLKFMSFDVYNSYILAWVDKNTEKGSAVVEKRKVVGVKLICGALAGATAGKWRCFGQ